MRAPLLLLLAAAGCAAPDPLAGLSRRDAEGCRPAGGPSVSPRLKLTRVFGEGELHYPVDMVPAPDAPERAYVVSQYGVIYSVDVRRPDEPPAEWLDLRDRVSAGGERGLLSLAFDPRFEQNGWLYVNFTTERRGDLQTIVARFRVPSPGTRPDPQGEEVLLAVKQPYENHNGGQIAFGPDGHLYVALGDGGAAGDPFNAAQRMDTLHGKILRLDVREAGPGYRLPPDNPFFTGQARADGARDDFTHCRSGGEPGVCGEIWALGLRNPWRFSFDPVSGALFAGDVGQGEWEEINLIERGGNYGWRCQEGPDIYNTSDACERGRMDKTFIAAIHQYPHAEGKSVSGGHVYRGQRLPGLYGTYLFADYVDGGLWGLQPAKDGTWVRTLLLGEAGHPSGFGRDSDGELYLLDHQAHRVMRIDPVDPGDPGRPGWPERLSLTGCFSDLRTRQLTPGALPYSVNAPLWADGAEKERALVLPPGQRLGYREDGTLELPSGTVLIKTFRLGQRPVETRLLVWDGEAVRGATYRWDEAGADATLLVTGATAEIDGQRWTFPSRGECLGCHTRAAGQVLGLTAAQLRRRHDMFGTGPVDQLEALWRLGYLDGAPTAMPAALAEPGDGAAPPAARARAYLQGNCAHCHQPGGIANATLDLRAGTPLPQTGACAAAQMGDLGVPGAQVLAPGVPLRSTLYLRMETLDRRVRMPPIGSLARDPEGTALLRAWIGGLSRCE